MQASAEPKLRGWTRAAVLGLIAGCATLAVFSPRFIVWRGLGLRELSMFPEINRATDALRQLHDPFAPIANLSNHAIQWRLLFPLLGHALRLPDGLFLGLPVLGCWLALTLAARILQERRWRQDEIVAGVLLLATCSWFLVSTGWLAYFDSWLVVALLLCGFSRRRGVVVAATFLAPWIDERFLFVLPACLILRETCALAVFGPRSKREQRLDLLLCAAALVPFVAFRLGVHLLNSNPADREFLAYLRTASADRRQIPWIRFVTGAWHGLRFGWIAVALLCGWLALNSPRQAAALLGAALLSLAISFGIAADLSRSASTVAPLVLAGLIFPLADRPSARRWLVWSLAGLNFIAPASHVVNNSQTAIHSFGRELAVWRNPPDIFRADFYNARATVLISENRAAEALPLLAHAIQLEPAFQPAYINRVTARVRNGELASALADAERALALDPAQPRAWLARALVREKSGDRAGAIADVKRAQSTAAASDPLQTQISARLESLGADPARH